MAKSRGFILLICILITTVPNSRAQTINKTETGVVEADRIIQLTYNCQFDDALKMVDCLSTKEPASVEWEFFRIVVLWHKLIFLDSAGVDDPDIEAQFVKGTMHVISLGEEKLAKNPADTSALFYTGFSLGYLAKYDAAKGDEFKAASDGNKGLSYHEKLLSRCPNWYDVYFSFALFDFYTSTLPWYLKPLLFILGKSGSKEKAYEYLTLTGRKGRFTKYDAEDILGELYAIDTNFDSLKVIYHSLISEFPNASIYYYYKLSSILLESKQYQLAVRECEKAIKLSGTRYLTYGDSLYLGKIYLRLATSYEMLEDYGNAMQTYNELISRRVTLSLVPWAHFSIGQLYERANDSQDAIREYEQVVNTGTASQLVMQARKRLNGLQIR